MSSGQERYPERIEERLRDTTPRVHMVDALAAAMALHEVRAVNMVMTGAASHFLPLPEEAYVEALKSRLPARVVEVNAQAFRAGRALVHPAASAGEADATRSSRCRRERMLAGQPGFSEGFVNNPD